MTDRADTPYDLLTLREGESTMTENDLVEKLQAMREHGPKDLMTMLFGLIFHQEIGSSGPSIAREYNRRRYAGPVNSTIIQNGRKLAEFADPHDDVVRKWRG